MVYHRKDLDDAEKTIPPLIRDILLALHPEVWVPDQIGDAEPERFTFCFVCSHYVCGGFKARSERPPADTEVPMH